MLKVFISQPMNGIPESEVMAVRDRIKDKMAKWFGKEIYIIDNYHHDNAPYNANPVWHLGTSISMMYDADYVVFVKGYEKARGCLAEEFICKKYDLSMLYERD